MRRKDSPFDGPISHEQLEFLAAISLEWREEQRRRERAAIEAASQQEQDDFVRAITRPNGPGTDREVTEEDVDRFVEAITRHDGSEIYEAGWDAAKHPRRGGPPNAGCWASTAGAGAASGSTTSNSTPDRHAANDSGENSDTGRPASSNRAPSQNARQNYSDQNDRKIQATTAEFLPSHEAPAHLTGSGPGGHHWVPRLVIRDLSQRMTEGAKKIFSIGTEAVDDYYHGNDAWNGVKHHEYSSAVNELLDDWTTTNGGKLDEEGARAFHSWLATGETKNKELGKLLAKHKNAVTTVIRWRAGFKQSIVVAARAAEFNKNLTGPELKAIAKLVVNGEAQALSPQAHAVAQAIIKGGKKALIATAKRVLPAYMFISAATAAKRGWAGQGHTGSGAWGAANEVARDAIAADVVEQMVFPAALGVADGVTNIVAPGINDSTRYHRFKRNGVWIDARTGLPSE